MPKFIIQIKNRFLFFLLLHLSNQEAVFYECSYRISSFPATPTNNLSYVTDLGATNLSLVPIIEASVRRTVLSGTLKCNPLTPTALFLEGYSSSRSECVSLGYSMVRSIKIECRAAGI